MEINEKAKQLAVVGNPVSHSLSPAIHNLLAELTHKNYVYTTYETPSFEGVPSYIINNGLRGINVTSPFKIDAYNAVDILSESARAVGSVNTIVNNNGVLTGYSTDGEGLYTSMELSGITIKGKRILVLGAGGVAKPVCVMLKNKGAREIVIKNRTISRAEALAKSLRTDIVSVYNGEKNFDIIINTTTVGMGTDELCLDDLSLLDGAEVAIDLIYFPKKTRFLEEAEKRNIKILNGFGMLVFQGVKAFEYFCGEKIELNIYKEVYGRLNG